MNWVDMESVEMSQSTWDSSHELVAMSSHESVDMWAAAMHRWLVAQKDPVRNGEMYRIIADTGGAFVQPALYEAFGLTVVEVSYHPQLSCMLWPDWTC